MAEMKGMAPALEEAPGGAVAGPVQAGRRFG